jgi:hypothetical protein
MRANRGTAHAGIVSAGVMAPSTAQAAKTKAEPTYINILNRIG